MMTPDPAARACWSTAAGLASRGLRCWALPSGARVLMEMPTTAGVIFLRTGASVGIPLACCTTGSGMLAFAEINPLVAKARPTAVALNIWFIASTLLGQTAKAQDGNNLEKSKAQTWFHLPADGPL